MQLVTLDAQFEAETGAKLARVQVMLRNRIAYEEGRITRPMHVDLPAPLASRKTWLTREQAARLIRASRTPPASLYMPLFILLVQARCS